MNRRTALFKLIAFTAAGIASSTGGITAFAQAGQIGKRRRKLLFYHVDYGDLVDSVVAYGLKPNLSAGAKEQTWMTELDIDTLQVRSAALSPMRDPHSILHNLEHGNYVCVPRIGYQASVVSSKSMKESFTFKPTIGFYFYGHGAIHPHTGHIYLSQASLSGDGNISVRDPKTMRELFQIESFGSAPHDLHFLETGDLLVANNGWNERLPSKKTRSSFAILKIKGKKSTLLERTEIEPSYLTAQHMALMPNTGIRPEVFLGLDAPWADEPSAKGTSLVARTSTAGRIVNFHEATHPVSEFSGNVLSIACDQKTQTTITTTPQSHLAIWDIKLSKLALLVKDASHPMGVVQTSTEEESSYVVTTANSGILKIAVKRDSSEAITIVRQTTLATKKIANIMGHSTLVEIG